MSEVGDSSCGREQVVAQPVDARPVPVRTARALEGSRAAAPRASDTLVRLCKQRTLLARGSVGAAHAQGSHVGAWEQRVAPEWRSARR